MEKKEKSLFAPHLAAKRHKGNTHMSCDDYDDHVESDCYNEEDDHDK